MAGELRLVHCHVLDADGAFAALHLDHPVDQQHRIAMRDHLHDAENVDRLQAAFGLGLSHSACPSSAPVVAVSRSGGNIPSPSSPGYRKDRKSTRLNSSH